MKRKVTILNCIMGRKYRLFSLKKHVEKISHFGDFMGKLRLILNSIRKYNINSITGRKNNMKNLYSCSANRNLKNATELILDVPELILQQLSSFESSPTQ